MKVFSNGECFNRSILAMRQQKEMAAKERKERKEREPIFVFFAFFCG
jgi:hypothetical protein